MDDAVNGPTFCNPLKRRKQCGPVCTIHLLYLGLKSQNTVQSNEDFFRGVGEIIHHDRGVPGIDQLNHCV